MSDHQKQEGEGAAKNGSEKAADGSEQTPANVDAFVVADERGPTSPTGRWKKVIVRRRGLTRRRPSVQATAPAPDDIEPTVLSLPELNTTHCSFIHLVSVGSSESRGVPVWRFSYRRPLTVVEVNDSRTDDRILSFSAIPVAADE